MEDLDRLYKKKPLIRPVDYPRKKTYRHGCIRPTNARINQFKKRYEQGIKMSHKIFTRIEKESKDIAIKFEYPPKFEMR